MKKKATTLRWLLVVIIGSVAYSILRAHFGGKTCLRQIRWGVEPARRTAGPATSKANTYQ